MVFSSLTFLFLYLPLFLIAYYSSPTIKLKNIILFVASLLFYAWGEPIYVVIMIISTLNDYYHSIWIHNMHRKGEKEIATIALISSFAVNLGLLGFFKYGDFAIRSINALAGTDIPLMNLPLPVGISFYTFQTMSYTIDVYRKKVALQRSFLDLATYVTMFPQLIAGPIVRYETVEREIRTREISWDLTAKGIRRLIIGLAKKVLLANQMAIIADTVFGLPDAQRGLLLSWLGIIAYAFQIYFDFSGYSDMAIGLGWMLGFHFLENFEYPYIARSITEFWRRWHISLSTWFRDYLYIPLGGNRKGGWIWLRNIMIVWTLTGLWHGAAWNFVLWGIYFGIILIIERLFLYDYLKKLPIIGNLYAMVLVLFGWVLFRSESLAQIGQFSKGLLGFNGLNSFAQLVDLDLVYLLPVVLLSLISATPWPKAIVLKAQQWHFPILIYDLYLAAIFILSVLFLVNQSFNPFIYYRF